MEDVRTIPHEAAWSLLERNRDRGEEVALDPVVVDVEGRLALSSATGYLK